VRSIRSRAVPVTPARRTLRVTFGVSHSHRALPVLMFEARGRSYPAASSS